MSDVAAPRRSRIQGRGASTDLPRHPEPFLVRRPLDAPSHDHLAPPRRIPGRAADGERTRSRLDARRTRRRHEHGENASRPAVPARSGHATDRLPQRLRAQAAARLLVQTDQPIAHIGTQLGWDDAGYFARRFKTAYGLSPSAYRRRALAGQAHYHSPPELPLPVSGARFEPRSDG